MLTHRQSENGTAGGDFVEGLIGDTANSRTAKLRPRLIRPRLHRHSPQVPTSGRSEETCLVVEVDTETLDGEEAIGIFGGLIGEAFANKDENLVGDLIERDGVAFNRGELTWGGRVIRTINSHNRGRNSSADVGDVAGVLGIRHDVTGRNEVAGLAGVILDKETGVEEGVSIADTCGETEGRSQTCSSVGVGGAEQPVSRTDVEHQI